MATRLLSYLLFAVGLLPYYLLPIWAGVFSESYQFGGSNLGLLLSADMVGGTIAAVSARYWISRTPWRPVLIAALLLGVASNLLCVLADGFGSLLFLRFLAGIAAGTFMAIVYAEFARAQNPDREFSIALALQVAFGAAAIWLAPQMGEAWGRAGSFAMVGLATMLPLILASACPEKPAAHNSSEEESGNATSVKTWFGLAAIGLIFTSLSCVWAGMERLATTRGVDAPVVTAVLSAALLFSFLGAAAPAFASSILPRKLQMRISYAALVLAIVVIGNDPSIWLFAAGLAVYNFFYSFVIPYQTAWVAETDAAGRNAVLVPVVQGIGVSVGPAIGGALLGSGNYAGVVYVSVAILIASLACAVIAGDPIDK